MCKRPFTRFPGFLTQTDDDCYVRVDRLLAGLASLPQHNLYWGGMRFNQRPNRDPDDIWHIAVAEWTPDAYPPYAPGVGFVVSSDLVQQVAAGVQQQ